MRHNEQIAAVIDELKKHGASILSVEIGGKHPRVNFEHAGRQRFIVTAGSGSDCVRGARNARNDVRRELGLIRGKRVGERRQRKQHIDRPAEKPTKLTPGRDPFVELRQARLKAFDPDTAWKALFGQILVDNGHQPVNPGITEAMGR